MNADTANAAVFEENCERTFRESNEAQRDSGTKKQTLKMSSVYITY